MKVSRLPRPRPDLADLTPYGSSQTSGGRILLHANENPYPLPDGVMEEILSAARQLELNRYPAPEPLELRDEIARYAGVDPEWVWVGDGSNEVLLQACLAYGGPGRVALLFEPTYRMHHRQARMAGTRVENVWRRGDFTIDVDAALARIAELGPDIVFVCAPNNPTGTPTPPEDVVRIAGACDGLVVVDEAYFEFSSSTVVPHIRDHPNMLVVRTLSKAFRLASIRLGYGIAHPELLTELARVRMPYAQSAFTQLAATIVLRHRDEVLGVVAELVSERERISAALSDFAEVFESHANFVLFRPPDPGRLLEALRGEGIVIRDFRALPGCEGCLRVTVGRPEENDAFLDVTSKALDPIYHRDS